VTQLPESIRTMDDRLASLEASNRRLKRGLASVVVIGLGAIGLGAGQPGWGSGSGQNPPREEIRDEVVNEVIKADGGVVDTIRAKRVIIVDDDGEPKIVLGANDNGQAAIVLVGPEKMVTLNASLEDNAESPGPVLVFEGTSGRVSLMCINDLGPLLIMQDQNSATRVFIGPTDDGISGVIELNNPSTDALLRLVPGMDD